MTQPRLADSFQLHCNTLAPRETRISVTLRACFCVSLWSLSSSSVWGGRRDALGVETASHRCWDHSNGELDLQPLLFLLWLFLWWLWWWWCLVGSAIRKGCLSAASTGLLHTADPALEGVGFPRDHSPMGPDIFHRKRIYAGHLLVRN